MNRISWTVRALTLVVASVSIAGCVGHHGRHHSYSRGDGYHSYNREAPSWRGRGDARSYGYGEGRRYGWR
jgi:hypothetical protein